MSAFSNQRLLLTGSFTALVVGYVLLLGGCPVDTGTGDDTDTGDNTGTIVGDDGISGKFIGSSRCGLCHVTTHGNWSETIHATALETLEAIGQDTNAQCLPCHVVGYGETGGFVDRASTNDLAGVGCESCHGGAREHAENVVDRSLRPEVSISSEMCGTCHTGTHHPHYEEWTESAHATVDEHTADSFAAGSSLSSCGTCHSGDYYYQAVLKSRTVDDDLLKGLTVNEMNAVECAICHDPHQQTGNAADPDEGRDFQLRFVEVKTPVATNTIAAATDATRFNLCGQCHHSRGREWTATSRGPHHSVQSNVYFGEMALPETDSGFDTDVLVFSRVSVHSFAPEQCATCHMFRQDYETELAPAISGHSFEVNQFSCTISGCHPSVTQARAVQATLKAEIQGRLDRIEDLLGAPATWEYAAEGGPVDQDAVAENVKKARFLYHYVLGDGSLGMHNPDYVRDMLEEAERLLTE